MSSNPTNTERSLHTVQETPATDDVLRHEINCLAVRFGTGRGALIPMLSIIKSEKGDIPSPALDEIADALGVDYAKVHSVASFYSLLDRVDRSLPLAS